MINYTLVGILCSVTGNFLISFAFNIQKYAHTKLQHQNKKNQSTDETSSLLLSSDSLYIRENSLNDNECAQVPTTNALQASLPIASETESHGRVSHDLDTNYLSSPYWWLGAIIMTIGETGNFIAYGFAPVSIVSPLGIVTIISNCSIAPLVFNEPIRYRDIIGTVFASIGVLLVILSSLNKKNENGDTGGINEDPIRFIHETITSMSYFYYLIGSVCAAAILMFQLSKLKVEVCKNTSLKKLYAFGNVLLVAIFGAHTALATKCLSTLIEFSHSLLKLSKSFDTYYLICILVLTAVFQIKFLNNSLQVESSTTVIPIHFVFFTISVLVGSAIVFHDQDNKNAASVIFFLAGCILTFISVFLIVGGGGKSSPVVSEDNMLFEEERLTDSLNIVTVDNNDIVEQHIDPNTPLLRKFIDDSNSPSDNIDGVQFLNSNKNQFYSISNPSHVFRKMQNPMKLKISSSSDIHDRAPQEIADLGIDTDISKANENDKNEPQPISRSTSIVEQARPNIHDNVLNIPKIRVQLDNNTFQYNRDFSTDNDSDIYSSRSLPSQKKWDFKLSRRFLNRSRSFNRIFDSKDNYDNLSIDKNTELVGNGGNLIFNYVLSNLRDNHQS